MTKKKDCSHFTNIDKEQLDKMLKKITTFKYVPKFTINGCIQRRFFLVKISRIAKKLGFDRKVLKQNQFVKVAKQRQISQIKMMQLIHIQKIQVNAYRESILLNLKKEKQIVKK